MLGIGYILFLLVGAVCLTNFIDDCMEPGMILSIPGAFIKKETRLNEKIKNHKKHIDVPWWKKPLGACIFCSNVWVITGIYVLYNYCTPAVTVLCMIGIGNSLLKLILKNNL